ncbi:uncharacterized protein LOC116853576 [Odontomachus brunneus]|uniref:uncharacterized protein LOC116853576 n=1 Tax=Odontomachus brunneus TaxID=486640 RepID=UPI0013F22D71|nr:uncharacterized protein LOC116853576 [Odontomachus brunneus]
MVNFFYLNKGLAEGKFNTLHGKEESQQKWKKLANELNSFQGATKTVEQWQVVWRDLKSRTSIKVKDLRKAKRLTGNKAITLTDLTELEQRVIGVIGAEYVEGSKCADSIPDEENLLEELEHGNNSVLSEIPQVILGANSLDNIDLYDKDLILDSISDDCLLENNSSEHNAIIRIEDNIDVTQNLANCDLRKAPKNISFSTIKNTQSPSLRPAKQSSPKINVLTSRKFNRVTSSGSLKKHFQFIAQKQADAEFIYAESAKIQAEASKMNALAITEIAHAITKLADTAAVQAINDNERIQVFNKLTTVLENLAPTYLNE